MTEPYARRSAEQVIASARAMDQARAAGLPDDLLAILLDARRAWWTAATDDPAPWPPLVDLGRALAHPASALVDQTLCAAIRRHMH